MIRDHLKLTPGQWSDHLFNVINSRRFLKMEGLGNEVPFFICPFDPAKALEVEKQCKQLVKRLEKEGRKILDINLYKLSILILEKRNIWDRVLQMADSLENEQLKELLQGALDTENHLIPAIAEKMEKTSFDVMFITGVGVVYPYIRSHNVLNNLQRVAKERPTLMFFPGDYNQSLEHGSSLELFGLLRDDKYYRAFNIFHCEAQ